MLINSSHLSQLQQLAHIMQCKAIKFLLKYLGLPLSDKSLTRRDYQLLIDEIESKLSGWQASKLSVAGRIVTQLSVICHISLFYIHFKSN
jgi:hypothetical protein